MRLYWSQFRALHLIIIIITFDILLKLYQVELCRGTHSSILEEVVTNR